MADYAHPEVLVDTAWVDQHKNDPGVRIAEVDVDTAAYEQGPRPGRDRLELDHAAVRYGAPRHVIPRTSSRRLMAEAGIGNDTTVVLYGDNNNWFAAWALREDEAVRPRTCG